jgi:hypothetical protein
VTDVTQVPRLPLYFCAPEHTYAIDLPSRPETPGERGTRAAGKSWQQGANRAVIRP